MDIRKIMAFILCLVMITAAVSCAENVTAGANERANEQDAVREAQSVQSGESGEENGEENGDPEEDEAPAAGDGYDIDLTTMNGVMVYAQVFDIISSPIRYMGKTIKMQGRYVTYSSSGNVYNACMISDATKCCARGIEFVLGEGGSYPETQDEITVTGMLDTYTEDGIIYCRVVDAIIE